MDNDVRIIEMPFATYYCFPHYIVARPKEGVIIKERHTVEALEKVHGLYNDPFVYIGDRVNASSVALAVYPFIQKEGELDLLRGIAVVAHRDITRVMAETERALAGKFAFEVFNSLDEAEIWALELLH